MRFNKADTVFFSGRAWTVDRHEPDTDEYVIVSLDGSTCIRVDAEDVDVAL